MLDPQLSRVAPGAPNLVMRGVRLSCATPVRLMKPLPARNSGANPEPDSDQPRSRPARVTENDHIGAVATLPTERVRLPAIWPATVYAPDTSRPSTEATRL